jgi:PAS domain S-box-containing protein
VGEYATPPDMTTPEPAPTRPDPPAAAESHSHVEGARGASAAQLLLTRGGDTRRESRHVVLGLAILVVVSVVLLNFWIYQNAQNRIVQGRWDYLTRHVDASREQIRALFATSERQLRFVAEGERLTSWVRSAMNGTIAPAEQLQMQQQLDRAAKSFGLDHLLVLSPEGVPLAADSNYDAAPARHADLVQRVVMTNQPWIADLHANGAGRRCFEIAMPVAGAATAGRVPVLVGATDAEATLMPLLGHWSDLGSSAFAYLVRRDGEQINYLTSPDRKQMLAPPAPVPMSTPAARPAAMAAIGIESSIEQSPGDPEPYCAVTRFLPELGWGLVARADRSVVMGGLRATVLKLLIVDLAILLATGLLIWQWRRSYNRGIAQHEQAVTSRHAERVQAIFDTAFDAIVTFDRSGRVRTVNRAAEELFGRSALAMENQPLHRVLRWSGPDTGSSPRELPTPGVVWLANALRPDGQSIPTEMSIGQSGDMDELLYTAIVRDIRDRVEAEKQIRAFAEGLESGNRRLEEVNAQLEEASRLKSEFLANTSHELRTPLNGMMGFLQLVLDGMCQSKEEEREFLKQALQCSKHLLNLINDVLDIARIEAGKLSLDIQKVEVSTLFQEVRTVTHVQATQKDVKLVFTDLEDPSCAVRCDLNKAKQVLINLVGNSLKFTPKGTIAVRAIARPDLGYVRFEVEDTGIGIPPEQQNIIFEKFAQGDGSTTRKFGGAGLGLAISKSLIELMGGVIGVRSEGRGQGTTMYFTLPAWSDQSTEALPEEETNDTIDGPSGGALVLVVEDDPVFRKFVTAVLHQHGYRTVEVPSAEGGWVLVRRLRPAVVVLDYALSCSEGAGIRTGWDLAQRITTDSETRHTPVLFVTGFEGEVRDRLRNTAFARKPEHLVKPIEPSALTAKVDGLVAGVSGRQARILMAEDDPAVTAFVRKVLPENRYYMEVVTNGEQCLHVLRTQPNGFDLLLLDLMMPGVSGYDVLRDMTLTGTAAKVPVLVLTNCPEPRSAEEKRLLEDGLVIDVIAKTNIHDSPQLLAHVIDWNLQVQREGDRPPEHEAEAA